MEHVHLIGIGGSGLSAIARLLLESGYTVTGSDRQLSPLVQDLQAQGVQVSIGHQPGNVVGADLVLRSSAIPEDNPEVQAALAAGLPVLKRADFLRRLIGGRKCIAVAGSHGKTTTTAMIAWILAALGQDPSYLIGGVSENLGTNARAGAGQAFVIEADEYDHTFLGLRPALAVVTNVEHDHPDCYPTAEEFYAAFRQFTGQIEPGGTLLACSDDPGAARLLGEAPKPIRTLAYGLERWLGRPCPNYCGVELEVNKQGGFDFQFLAISDPRPARRGQPPEMNGNSQIQVSLQVPGRHNVRNAVAALAVADILGLSLDQAVKALGRFRGTGRRFELRGEAGGITVIDDYAHHPTEIKATLAAARSRYPGRPIWAVWQPHTFSRTRALLAEFAGSFADADHLLVMEVFAAREPDPGDFSAQQVLAAMRHPDVHFVPDLASTVAFLDGHLRSGDVLMVLSAGDADQVSGQVLNDLRDKN